MGEIFVAHEPITDHVSNLPPRDYWLIDPNEKIEVATDPFGLVDIDKLVESVKQTVDESYTWRSDLDVHHFQWPAAWYPAIQGVRAADNPAYFRNLGIFKGLMPLDFHAMIHRFSEPLPPPEPEVIHYKVEAWNIAKSLFIRMRKTINAERMAKRRLIYTAQNPHILNSDFGGEDLITQEWMQDVLEKHFRGIAKHMADLESLPVEFRLVEPELPLNKLAKRLGEIVVPKAINPKRLGIMVGSAEAA